MFKRSSSTNGTAAPKTPTEGAWLEDVGAIGMEAARWVGVQADRARLRMRRRVFAATIALPLVVFGLTIAVLAGFSFVRGVTGGWLALFATTPWLGELAAAATSILVLLGGLRLWMRVDDAREIRRLREKHEDEPESTDRAARANA